MEIGFVTYDFEELRKEYTFDEKYIDIDENIIKELVIKYIDLIVIVKINYIQMLIQQVYLKMQEDVKKSKNIYAMSKM